MPNPLKIRLDLNQEANKMERTMWCQLLRLLSDIPGVPVIIGEVFRFYDTETDSVKAIRLDGVSLNMEDCYTIRLVYSTADADNGGFRPAECVPLRSDTNSMVQVLLLMKLVDAVQKRLDAKVIRLVGKDEDGVSVNKIIALDEEVRGEFDAVVGGWHGLNQWLLGSGYHGIMDGEGVTAEVLR